MVFIIGLILGFGFIALAVHFKGIIGAGMMFLLAFVVWCFEDRRPRDYSRHDYHD